MSTKRVALRSVYSALLTERDAAIRALRHVIGYGAGIVSGTDSYAVDASPR